MSSTSSDRLTSRDWRRIAMAVAAAAIAIFVIVRYFNSAFPEASIDFRLDRKASGAVAERLIAAQGVEIGTSKHAALFDSDDNARIFLERSLGLQRANVLMRDQVHVWYWHHRWFRPLVQEEVNVDVAPTGEIVRFHHVIPEDQPAPRGSGASSPDAAATAFLQKAGIRLDDLTLISKSERRLPKRMQQIFTWESKSIRPAGAPYRYVVTVDGNAVTSYAQELHVPETWLRSYRELRSKNNAAGSVDLVFLAATMIAAVAVFVVRLRRGDLRIRFLLGVGAVAVVLTAGVALNSMPSQLAWYDTTTSYPAYLAQLGFQAALQAVGTAMFLIVICGAGEVLYRERYPSQLAIPRLWTRRALASRRVFLSLILGYALVPLFIAYQVVFYIVAQKYGAWAPAEVPYDDIVNSAFPWIAVMFAGFFPALSEEFMSRAFSIPFLARLLRSPLAAIILAGFIWGFGHATYPNQPFYIRGVEVGLAGIVAGLIFHRFGLLPLLIWHYTIDAVYTATLLFRSGNSYYIASAAVASLLFLVPLLLSIVSYLRNRGFVADDDLSNVTLPLAPAGVKEERPAVPLPEPLPLRKGLLGFAVVAVVLAVIAVLLRPASPSDAIDYRITKQRAKEIARQHLRLLDARRGAARPEAARVIAAPVEGFRSWDDQSSREDGGAPGNFDSTAASYLVRNGMSVGDLVRVFRTKIQAGTWIVRFFTPMQKDESFVEIDPRTVRVIGYHRYQDEKKPGAALSRDAALAIARSAFPIYGVDLAAFDVKESLSFQQPKRLDWLFHFEERTPLAGRAFRRISVRVAGDEVTQFNANVKVPESVYREAAKQTLLNVVITVLKIAGMIALLAVVVTGLVMATRGHGLPWRHAFRATLLLAPLPLIASAAKFELVQFSYGTSMTWETFRVGMITAYVRDAGLQIGAIFLAFAGIEAAVTHAPALLTREARARFGRSAVAAALAALSLITISGVVSRAVTRAVPAAATVSISAPEEVALPFPAFEDAVRALFAAITLGGAVAVASIALRKRRPVIVIAMIFCASLDPYVTMTQTPLMLLRALAIAVLFWFIADKVLGRNPLAWPAAALTGALLGSAATLLGNHRSDLLAEGVILLLLAAGVLVWLALPAAAPAVESASAEAPGA